MGMQYSRDELAAVIDHTNLYPDATTNDLETICEEANTYGFGAVCVYAGNVPYVADHVEDNVDVCAVVNFPHGRSPLEVVLEEAVYAVDNGADEIDIVIHQGHLRDGEPQRAEDELRAVREYLDEEAPGTVMKVIAENCNLGDDEKVWAYEAAHDAGADFIKTSTGFGAYGARVEDVKLMAETLDRIDSDMGIKAAGGIGDAETALAMLEASGKPLDPEQFRIGASSGVDILNGLE